MLFNVEKTPSPGDGVDVGPSGVGSSGPEGGVVMEFVGLRCHANLGRYDFWPRVVRFKATISALQVRGGEGARKGGGIWGEEM